MSFSWDRQREIEMLRMALASERDRMRAWDYQDHRRWDREDNPFRLASENRLLTGETPGVWAAFGTMASDIAAQGFYLGNVVHQHEDVEVGTYVISEPERPPASTVQHHEGRPDSEIVGADENGDAVYAEKRESELRLIEMGMIRRLGEAGYESPWYIGPAGGVDGGAEEYWRWRKARDAYVVDPTDDKRDAMLAAVTMETPPLASDFGWPRRRRSDKSAAMLAVAVLAVVFTVMSLAMVIG
jgi:hypothetical protein